MIGDAFKILTMVLFAGLLGRLAWLAWIVHDEEKAREGDAVEKERRPAWKHAEELRFVARGADARGQYDTATICREAADEIDRLTEELRRAKEGSTHGH